MSTPHREAHSLRNLRTNHRGVFLQQSKSHDISFKMATRLGVCANTASGTPEQRHGSRAGAGATRPAFTANEKMTMCGAGFHEVWQPMNMQQVKNMMATAITMANQK